MPRKLWVLIGFIALVTIICLWFNDPNKGDSPLLVGQLIVLSITVMVLIKYAYDTYVIARSTVERGEQDLKPLVGWEIVPGDPEKRNTTIPFRLINTTAYFIDALVFANFKVYGEKVNHGPDFDGSNVWEVFPKNLSQQFIYIDTLLSSKGKNIDNMIAEQNDGNKYEQLTLELRLELTNVDTGRERITPIRKYWFDFDRWLWIPYLTRPRQTP